MFERIPDDPTEAMGLDRPVDLPAAIAAVEEIVSERLTDPFVPPPPRNGRRGTKPHRKPKPKPKPHRKPKPSRKPKPHRKPRPKRKPARKPKRKPARKPKRRRTTGDAASRRWKKATVLSGRTKETGKEPHCAIHPDVVMRCPACIGIKGGKSRSVAKLRAARRTLRTKVNVKTTRRKKRR